MFNMPISYEEPVFRPPSEGRSFLLQVTIGCSNNMCTYCDMYRSKKYRVRPVEEILEELEKAKKYFKRFMFMPKRIFLCDGDALGAPMDVLVPVLEKINELFPDLDRVGIYATADNMLKKTEEELKLLSSLKLNMAYLGLESGDDKILHMIVKKNTKEDMINGSLRLKKCGFKMSTIAMLGIGGRKYSADHIRETADVISKTSPEYFSFLTTMALPGTPYKKMVDRGSIEMLTTKELFNEMKEILAQIKPVLNPITFRANHVSNQYPIGGVLPQDTNSIVQTLEGWMSQTPDGIYPPMPSRM